jgi:hypothetical protein
MRLRVTTLSFVAVFLGACAGKVLQFEKSDEVLKNQEFEEQVKIEEAPVEPPPEPVIKEVKEPKKKKAAPKVEPPAKPKKAKVHLPELEDGEGFDGRRPIADPFRVGEKATFDVSYFNIVAGELNMEVKPFATVNGLKSYHFEINGKSTPFFSKIYAIEDKATTYLSYDDLVPLNLQISIKESKQLAETRTLFDWKTKKGSYWQKRITKEKGERSKKIDWDLEPFAQNVASAAFYMRVFKYDIGKTLAFRVADEGKNMVFKGEVIRKEKLKTPIGELDTVVIKPVITVGGIFKPVGDILIWLTDDDRKFLVRLESKIKIGTVVAKLKSLEKGRD